jgi:WD40 repeat protein/tetratricopeptide (TPR) repeat protein
MDSWKDDRQQETRENPYVGPEAFTREDNRFFFGRTREGHALRFLLMDRRLVLFYAESGAGKSSLINAQLTPDLEKEGFEVLPSTRVVSAEADPSLEPDNVFITNIMLNLDESDERPERFAHLRLADFLLDLVKVGGKYFYVAPGETGGELANKVEQPAAGVPGTSAAAGPAPEPPARVEGEFLHDVLDAPEAGEEPEPVAAEEDGFLEEEQGQIPPRALIIDQFEELFTRHAEASEARRDFFVQIGEAMEADPFLHVLLAIREDYVAKMTPYARLVPGELRTRYHMGRLSASAALEAIRGPAERVGLPFAEAEDPSQDVAQALVRNLRRIRTGYDAQDVTDAPLSEFVEPVQLQVVCYELWPRLAQRPDEGPGSDGLRFITGDEEIEWKDLLAICGDQDPEAFLSEFVTDALGDFYEGTICWVLERPEIRELGREDPAQAVSEGKIRDWFEKELITEDQTRDQVRRGGSFTGRKANALPNVVVDLLERRHIIRSETRLAGTWYELVHDQFIHPILRSNSDFRLALAQRSPLFKAAYDWHDAGRPPNLLYADRQLEDALEKVSEQDRQDSIVDAFLEESKRAQDRRDLEAAKQRERRAQVFIGVLAVLVLVFIGAAWFGIRGQRKATEEKKRADVLLVTAEWSEAEAIASSMALKASQQASGYAPDQPEPALLLSLEALRWRDSPDVRRFLFTELARNYYHSTSERKLFEVLNRVAFGPDGKVIAAASADGSITLWDVEDNELGCQRTYMSTRYSVYGLAFSPDGRTLASATGDRYRYDAYSENHSITLWDLTSEEPARQILADQITSVGRIAFSPNGQTLAAGNTDGTVTLWDLNAKDPTSETLTAGHTGWVWTVEFSLDGQYIASGSRDGDIVLWNPATGQVSQTLRGHKDWVNDVAFSPDGRTLASASDDDTIRLWDVATGRPIGEPLVGHNADVSSVAFSPDGMLASGGSGDQRIRLWNVETGLPIGSALTRHDGGVQDVAFSSDGQTLASVGDDGKIILWDIHKLLDQPLIRYAYGGPDAAVLSLDGRTLATVSENNTITLWDLTSREQIRQLSNKDRITGAAFSSDGRTLVVTSDDDGLQGVTLWSVRSDPITITRQFFLTHTNWVSNSLALSPDSDALATASQDSDIILWDIRASDPVSRTLVGHEGSVNDVAFSPEDTILASASDDHTIILWDVAAGRVITDPLTGHTDEVWSVAFSPDGRTLASASADNTILLWEIGKRPPVGLLPSHSERVSSMAFSEDGQTLILAGPNTVITRAVSLEEWRELACEIADRNLTQTEWEDAYGPDEPYHRTCPNYAIHPTVIEARIAKGKSYARRLDIKNAQEAFEQANDLVDEFNTFAGELAQIPGLDLKQEIISVLIERARELIGQDKRSTALDYLEEAINLGQTFELDSETILEAGLLAEQGRRQILDKEYDHALLSLDYAVELDPQFEFNQRLDLASLYYEVCKDLWRLAPDMALPACKNAVELATETDDVTLNRNICQNSRIRERVNTLSACEQSADVLSILPGETKTGRIEHGHSDTWVFEGRAEQIVSIRMNQACSELDPYLILQGPDGRTLDEDADSGAGRNAEIDRFVLPQDGFYFINASGSSAGAYELSLAEVSVEEIAFGDTVEGDVEDDVVWTFEGSAGQIVSIAMNEDDSGLDTLLTLNGPDGTTLRTDDNSGEGVNSLVHNYILPEDGSYTILPGGYSRTGAYTLALSEATVRSITFGDTVEGDVEDDVVWTFEGSAGQIVSVAMNEDDSGLDTRLTLNGPDGRTVYTDEDSGEGSNSLIRNYALPDDGSYTILPGGYSSSGAYTLALSEATAQSITFGELVRGDVKDSVIWTFEGSAGQIVSIAMNEDDSGLDTLLTLNGPDGTTLRTDDNSGEGVNSLIRNYVLPEDGSYTILAGGHSSSGAYTLALSEATAQTIAFGDTVEGDVNDGVIWAFEGQAGQIVSVAMNEDHSGLDTLLTFSGPDGSTLCTDDNSGGDGNSLIRNSILPQDGPYTILPGGYSGSGAYTLTLSEAKDQPILLDEPVEGDVSDGVVWTFEGQEGQIVSVAMNEDDMGLDTWLTIVGPDGTVVRTDDDSGDGIGGTNSLIRNLVLPEDGLYTILPVGYSRTGAYTLLLTEETARPITSGEPVSGDIADDVLWIFEGQAGQIVSIAMNEDGSGLDTRVTLRDPDGRYLRSDDNSGDGSNSMIRNVVLSKDGSYTIEAGGYGSSGAYTLLLTETVRQPIALNELIKGDVEDGVAWAFEGQAGQIVRIAMSEAGSGLDTRLTLLGPDGTILSSDDDGGYGRGSLIRGAYLPQDGTYTVLPDGDSPSGAYILILSKAIVQPIGFGETVDVGVEDDAVWTFEGQEGKFVRIEINRDDSDLDTWFKLGKPDGTTISTHRRTRSLGLGLRLPMSGTYTLEPQGLEEGTGTYSLALDEISSAGSLSYGDVITDDVTAASGEYWTFSGHSGDVVRIAMNSSSFEPYLELYDPNGYLRWEGASSRPNDDAKITLWYSGAYIIVARGVDDGETGLYTLSLMRTETSSTRQFCDPYDPVGKPKAQACPHVFTFDSSSQAWEFDTTILYNLTGPESETLQGRSLSRFDGRLLVREAEHEVSYINQLYVLVVDDAGEKYALPAPLVELQEVDDSYVILNQGDQVLLDFEGYWAIPNPQEAWVVAEGYYVPLSGTGE